MDPARTRVHPGAALAASSDLPSTESSLVRRVRNLFRFHSEPQQLSTSQFDSSRAFSAPQLTQFSGLEKFSIVRIRQSIESALIDLVPETEDTDLTSLFDNYYMHHGFSLLQSLVQEIEEDFTGSKLTFDARADKADFLGTIRLILKSQDTVDKKLERLSVTVKNFSIKPSLEYLSIVIDCIKELCALPNTYELLLTAISLYKTDAPFKYYGTTYPSLRSVLNKSVSLAFVKDFLLVDPEQVSRSVNPSGTLLPAQILVGRSDFLDKYRSSHNGTVTIDLRMMGLFYLSLVKEIAYCIPVEQRLKWYPSDEIMNPAVRGYFEKSSLEDVSFKQDLYQYFGLFPLLRILPLLSVNCMSLAKLVQSAIFQPLRECREFLLRSRGERSIQFLWNSDTCCLECIREWEEGIYLAPRQGRDEKLVASTVCMCKIQLPLQMDAKIQYDFEICEYRFADNTSIDDIKELCKVLPECIKVARHYFY